MPLPSPARRWRLGRSLARALEAVARDVKEERVSTLAAREEYGVALDPSTFEIDRAATAALRQTGFQPRAN